MRRLVVLPHVSDGPVLLFRSSLALTASVAVSIAECVASAYGNDVHEFALFEKRPANFQGRYASVFGEFGSRGAVYAIRP